MLKKPWHDDVVRLHEEGWTDGAIRKYLADNRGVDATEMQIQHITGSNSPMALAKGINSPDLAVDVVYEYTKDYKLMETLSEEAKAQQQEVLSEDEPNRLLWLKMQQFRLAATSKRIDALTNLATAARMKRDDAMLAETDDQLLDRVVKETCQLILRFPELWPRLQAAVEGLPKIVDAEIIE